MVIKLDNTLNIGQKTLALFILRLNAINILCVVLKSPSAKKLERTLFFVVSIQQGPSLLAVGFAMTQCYISLNTDNTY